MRVVIAEDPESPDNPLLSASAGRADSGRRAGSGTRRTMRVPARVAARNITKATLCYRGFP